MNPVAESERPVPRVMRVEHCERDTRFAMMRGEHSSRYKEWTEADVMTPMGEIHVIMSGFHAQRKSYPGLITKAMDEAWRRFCNV